MKKDMYSSITKEEIDLLLKTIKIVRADLIEIDNKSDDGESHILLSSYSGTQTFGATDYADHRKDTTEQLTKKVVSNLYGFHQRGHFYDSEGNMVDTLVIKGYLGGYTGWFKYKSNKTAFGRSC